MWLRKSQKLFKENTEKSKKVVLINLQKAQFFVERNIEKSTQLVIVNFQKAQDFIERNVQRSKKEVLVNQSSVWAKAITYSLIGGTTFGVAWLCIAETEEIVISQGKLEPISGVIPIQIPLQGVTKTILVKEGEKVKKGQLLIELDTEVSKAKRDSLKKSFDVNNEILNKLEKLVKEGAVSELQYLQQQLKLSELESNIATNNLTLRYQRIESPIDGRVFNLIPQEPGYVANTSEPVLKIVPEDNLQAKVEIDSSKIGFVKVGKKVDISIDSFPASDFGVITGEVSRVSSDALNPDPRFNKGFRYTSDIKINTQYLETKSGKKLPLQAGMSLTANIKLRKVSYIKLLLGTFESKTKSLKSL